LNKRLKEVRKSKRLSQDAFGARLGVTGAAVSRIESGSNSFTDQMLILVCREFNVNETWLRSGEGEMFRYSPEDTAAQLAEEFGLDDFGKSILIAYQKLPADARAVVKQYVLSVAEAYNAENSIQAKLSDYAQELRQEEITETSSASQAQGAG